MIRRTIAATHQTNCSVRIATVRRRNFGRVTYLILSLRSVSFAKQISTTSSRSRCHDGKCVNSSLRCNGEYDCPDHSDELNCKMTCSPDEFRCQNGTACINS